MHYMCFSEISGTFIKLRLYFYFYFPPSYSVSETKMFENLRPHFFYYLFYGQKFSEIMSGFGKKIKKLFNVHLFYSGNHPRSCNIYLMSICCMSKDDSCSIMA